MSESKPTLKLEPFSEDPELVKANFKRLLDARNREKVAFRAELEKIEQETREGHPNR